MPTVLDFLRTHVGDELADRLEQTLDARIAMLPPPPTIPLGDRPDFLGPPFTQADVPIAIREALSTPSPGYEPLLIKAGWSPLLARGMAKLAVRHGRRCANESKWRRPVVDAIRFLAERQRQRRAIIRRAQLLLRAWNETSIIETIFDQAGLNETEFICLLQALVEDRQVDYQRITRIAGTISPRLSLPRGPKVSAPSAAHEFLLSEPKIVNCAKRLAAVRENRAEYVDPITQATRREFAAPDFDPRPARRRLKTSQKRKALNE